MYLIPQVDLLIMYTLLLIGFIQFYLRYIVNLGHTLISLLLVTVFLGYATFYT